MLSITQWEYYFCSEKASTKTGEVTTVDMLQMEIEFCADNCMETHCEQRLKN